MFREGHQIGLYSLVRKLGKGGFGEVWLAEKRSQFFTKKVAVKLPHDEQVDFETIRREAQLWEEASGHPNVLPIIDADVYDGQVVIVSEYADGGSLADYLKTYGKFPLQEAVEMTAGILNGLEFLHGKKIIHRDIKPQNILLQGDTPRLADFGISRAMNTSTISSVVVGTDSYMAPEAFDGKRNVQTDIWSVGVVLYQLLKGSLPFPQEHPSERMFAVLTKDFEPLSEEIPSGLRKVVEKALAKNPAERYQSAREMRDELRNYLSAPTPTPKQLEQPTIVLPPPTVPSFNGETPTVVSVNEDVPTVPSINEAAPTVPSAIEDTQPAYFSPPPTDNQSVVTRFRIPPEPTEDNAPQKNKSWLQSGEHIIAIALLLFFIGGGIMMFLAIVERDSGTPQNSANDSTPSSNLLINATTSSNISSNSNASSNANYPASNMSNASSNYYPSGNTISSNVKSNTGNYTGSSGNTISNVPYSSNSSGNTVYHSGNTMSNANVMKTP